MGSKNKKNPNKLDLLEMPAAKRDQMLKLAKARLHQRISEAKLWQSLLEIEALTVEDPAVEQEELLKGIIFK
jgi:hypothetical protein